jgi:hypothetical protein
VENAMVHTMLYVFSVDSYTRNFEEIGKLSQIFFLPQTTCYKKTRTTFFTQPVCNSNNGIYQKAGALGEK